MKKKLLMKYVLLCLPFVFGSVMFSLGIYNIVSSLLFFVGGYITLKNFFDYRKIRKNINSVADYNVVTSKRNNVYKSYDSVVGLKRTRRYHRVRKRVKNIDF